MNSKLNLWSDKKNEFSLKNEEITQERIKNQTIKCEALFDDWRRCIKLKSWNDVECVGQKKPTYESCIQNRNLMQSKFDEME